MQLSQGMVTRLLCKTKKLFEEQVPPVWGCSITSSPLHYHSELINPHSSSPVVLTLDGNQGFQPGTRELKYSDARMNCSQDTFNNLKTTKLN